MFILKISVKDVDVLSAIYVGTWWIFLIVITQVDRHLELWQMSTSPGKKQLSLLTGAEIYRNISTKYCDSEPLKKMAWHNSHGGLFPNQNEHSSHGLNPR